MTDHTNVDLSVRVNGNAVATYTHEGKTFVEAKDGTQYHLHVKNRNLHRVKVVLSVDNWCQIWVPPGFAHGYCTLEDDTEVQYKVTDFYSSPHERGIAWNDPQLAIPWPVTPETATVSERDRMLPCLARQPDLFEYRA